MTIDLQFPLLSTHAVPADHGYLLYSAVSRLLPELHADNGYGIHPIRGQQLGGRTLQLTEASRLIIRTDANCIAQFLPLAGKTLQLLDRRLCIGVPQVRGLIPAPALRSRLVTIKLKEAAENAGEPAAETFAASARRQLDVLGISPESQLHLGKRRTLRIKDKEVVGYEVLIEQLTADESLGVQEHGLGGRRHMGCGIFVPFRTRATEE
ncbi:MAG: type I-MYXAN CRISPR-associated protein Cas6/Cmx6 [bacterium]